MTGSQQEAWLERQEAAARLLPEVIHDEHGRPWHQTAVDVDEYCAYWAWCGREGNQMHRTAAELTEETR